MRYLALLLLFVSSVEAQSSLMVGMLGRTTVPNLSGAKDFDVTYLGSHYGALFQYENSSAWSIAFRVHLNRYFFLQETIRDNRVTDAGAHPRQAMHPWLVQSGAGIDFTPVKRERVVITASPSDRLKTVQAGYILGANSYLDCGRQITFHAQYVRSRLLSESNQIGVGFDYVFHFKR